MKCFSTILGIYSVHQMKCFSEIFCIFSKIDFLKEIWQAQTLKK